MLTVEKGRVQTDPKKHEEDTWYPGYTWQYAYCGQCGKFIGWQFTRKDDDKSGVCLSDDGYCPTEFSALIIDAVLFEGGMSVICVDTKGAVPLHMAAGRSDKQKKKPRLFRGEL